MTRSEHHPSASVGNSDLIVITWGIGNYISSDAVYGRIINKNGMPMTDEFIVSDASYQQAYASVAFDFDNNFIVTWKDHRTGVFGDSHVYANKLSIFS
jgi:hypothetical protein